MQPLVPEFYPATYPNSTTHHIFPVGHEHDPTAISNRSQWLEERQRIGKSPYFRYLTKYLADLDYSEELKCLIAEHGIFAEWVLRRDRQIEIQARIKSSDIDPTKFERLYEKAKYSRRYRESSPRQTWDWDLENAAFHSYVDFIEQLIYDSSQSPEVVSSLQEWYGLHGGIRVCGLCKREFNLIDVPWFFYIGTSFETECCLQCEVVEDPNREELDRLIPEFIQEVGFVPNSDASPVTSSFTIRLTPARRLEVFRMYARMGGLKRAKKIYGSWFEALAHTGALPGGVQVTKRGVRCLAKDGHVCRSLDEQHIDNWLYHHGYAHECEPHYPHHPELNPNGGMRADWKVGNLFIEYFGLSGNSDYDTKTARKIDLAQQMNIPLLAVYPRDMMDLDEVLGQIDDLLLNHADLAKST